MKFMTDILISDMRRLVNGLGNAGGSMTPSVYDTAQVLRHAPPIDDVSKGVHWLLEQQRPDGGWGDVFAPQARDVPTIAAMLTLKKYGHTTPANDAIEAAEQFLIANGPRWQDGFSEKLTVGVELLLPYLLEEAYQAGLNVSAEPYQKLFELRQIRFKQLSYLKEYSIKHSTAVHSWEAWGDAVTADLIEGSTGVGHSPAATAIWLQRARQHGLYPEKQDAARLYLEKASYSAETGIVGVYPTLWPIPRYEQAFGLYMLLTAGLLNHEALADVVQPKVEELWKAMTPDGIGLSDHFKKDGDDTAVTLAILRASGITADLAPLELFNNGDHYCAFAGELQASLSVTAHAAHALCEYGYDQQLKQIKDYVVSRQLPDGSWPGDKWNNSWIYVTSQILIGMFAQLPVQSGLKAIHALLDNQRLDGGWGTYESNGEETAYALLGLRTLNIENEDLSAAIRQSIRRGISWMLRNYRPFQHLSTNSWIGKESYCPRRIAKITELSAMLACLTDDIQPKDVTILDDASSLTVIV